MPRLEVGGDVTKFFGDEEVVGLSILAVGTAGEFAGPGAGDAMGWGFAFDGGAAGLGNGFVGHEIEEGLAEGAGLVGELGFGARQRLGQRDGGAVHFDGWSEGHGGLEIELESGDAFGGLHPAVGGALGDAVGFEPGQEEVILWRMVIMLKP